MPNAALPEEVAKGRKSVHGVGRYSARRGRQGAGAGKRGLAVARAAAVLLCGAAAQGCEAGPGGFGTLRFGQIGEVEVRVRAPLNGGVGWQEQLLTWESSGAWRLYEEIGYREVVGEQSLTPNPGIPELFATAYASFIDGVNTNDGWKLFLEPALPSLPAEPCGVASTEVALAIRDHRRGQDAQWARCVAGTLRSLRLRPDERDVTTARVVEAATYLRNLTVGEGDDAYAYAGSWPFATLDKGDESGLTLDKPRVFRSSDDHASRHEAPADWEATWQAHARADRPLPEVDWATEMVLLGTVGPSQESGDTVEVRRILYLGAEKGTQIDFVHQVPGDFCAPVSRVLHPFHFVVAPRAPAPVFFADTRVERVHCGGS